MRFFAGVGTCLMLIAAAGCVGFAVYLMLDSRPPVQIVSETYVAPALSFNFEEDRDFLPEIYYNPYPENESTVETTSWIHVITPSDDFFASEETPRTPTQIIDESFSFLPFYINENVFLYAEFQQKRPDLDAETIIWMVNASVHVPFYSQISVNYQPNPLFITPASRLPDNFSPSALVPVNNENCFLRATPEAVEAFRELRAASREAGFDLSVQSAYRTAARQNELWQNGGRRDGRVARSFHSEHQTGRALDLWGPGGLLDATGQSPTGKWVSENLHNFGYIIRYRAETTHITGYIYEPWHITFVGREISMYMHENNILSLEEFVGKNPGAALQ